MRQDDMTVIYLCNAVDEDVKKERHVRFDSPAATNKVLGIGKALRIQGVKVFILSLGRGRQTNTGMKFPSVVKRVMSLPTLYAAFWHYPVLTHLIGALSMATLLLRLLHNKRGKISIIAYNRLWHYLPALVIARLLSKSCYLDLEDGTLESIQGFSRILNSISRTTYDLLCNDGALLAAKALAGQVKTKHHFVCYGCSGKILGTTANWDEKPLHIIFGGSLLFETGVQVLMDAITILKYQYGHLQGHLTVSVTGQGLMSEKLRQFSETEGRGWVNYLGNVDRTTYLQILDHTHIGLCLKLPSTEMGMTTFPSKIIEYATHGLLIVSTKVSDVPDLLSADDAYLLPNENPQSLAETLLEITNDVQTASKISVQGRSKLNHVCNYITVGQSLTKFLQQGSEEHETR